MTAPPRVSGRLRLLRPLGRSAAVATVWLVAVAIGAVCFFPPGASFPPGAPDDWAAFDRALVFGSSTAIASAVTVAVAFVVVGKMKWARSVISAVTVAIALLTAAAYTCLWLAPWLLRSSMGYGELVRLRNTMPRWSAAMVRYQIPLGALVGLLLGSFSGVLAILARRRPRLAMGLFLGLISAGSSEPVQEFTFDLVLSWGQVVRSRIWSPGMTDTFVPALGVTLGAIAGAIVAAVAMRWERSRPSSERIASPRP
jgi:hypothetical protein